MLHAFFPGLFQAKALAEKNMRDLLAQKEQAERNVIIYLTSMLEILKIAILHTFPLLSFNLFFIAEIGRNSGC